MTKAQRRHLERRLLEERTRVTDALRRYEERTRDSEREKSGDLSAYPLHMADVGSDGIDQELGASLAARDTRTLVAIDEALQRLYNDPDHFGRCDVEGEEIPFERLDIIPWARTCERHASPKG